MTALVLGANGFIGLNLVDALVRDNHPFICGRRKRANVIPLRSRKVPMTIADLDQPASLVAGMTGVDTVYHCAAHYPRLSNDPDGAIRLGLRQLDNALEAAARAGVRRMVFVSSTATVASANGRASDESDVYASEPTIGTYHRLKWQLERRALTEDRFEVVVACPSGCLGPWDLRVGTSALIVALARGLDPPHPDGLVNLVDVADVATALVTLGTSANPPRRMIISAGTYGLHSLLERLAIRYSVARPSAALGHIDAIELADREERRVAESGGRAALSREIVDLIVSAGPVSGDCCRDYLGLQWRPLEQTLDTFDNWARKMGFIPPPPPMTTETTT